MDIKNFALKWLKSGPESGLDWLICSKLDSGTRRGERHGALRLDTRLPGPACCPPGGARPYLPTAVERICNNFDGFEEFRTENGSSQSQNG